MSLNHYNTKNKSHDNINLLVTLHLNLTNMSITKIMISMLQIRYEYIICSSVCCPTSHLFELYFIDPINNSQLHQL